MTSVFAISTVIAALLAQAAEPALAGDKSMGSYTIMDLDWAGHMVCSFDGKIDSMSDGVKITLRSEDPAKKPVLISANQVKFTWPAAAGGSNRRPVSILLEGKVVVEHPEASVRAEKAEWDFDKGLLTFTGSPVMSSAKFPDGIEAQKVVLDFNTGLVQVYGGHGHNVRLVGTGEEKEAAKSPAAEGEAKH